MRWSPRVSPLLVALGAGLLFAQVSTGAALATGSGSYVDCMDFAGGNVNEALLKKPTNCAFHVEHGTPGGLEIRRLRWRNWGAGTARATGTYIGNMNFRAPATITVYRREPCTGYGYVYTRMALKVGTAPRDVIRLTHCV
jgi:hypothetical protein